MIFGLCLHAYPVTAGMAGRQRWPDDVDEISSQVTSRAGVSRRSCTLLARLKDIGTKRDKAGNRLLFYDQYISLLLLYFFNPTITSLRGLQQASTLEIVQRRLGIRPTSLGSFSEAARVFDAEALQGNPPGTGSTKPPP